ARAHGMDATFMSKPFQEDSGSGLQINLSLQTEDGANAFDPARPHGDALHGHAVAGMQAMLAQSLAIFAPNFHAYRRFEPDQFTPVTLDWGDNNRSVAFRVPASDGPGRRIEHRAAGAEANPYLVMAAVLAAAHHGITGKLAPTEKAGGNAGAEADPSLPNTLWAALAAMSDADILPDYFERRYIDAYVHAKQAEFDAFLADILPREHDWYL
ncbi:MAG: glutamine synthetase, partial [Pseudomonadota bacterium]